MSYSFFDIDTALPKAPQSKILIIYTGGTMGMVFNEQGSLVPFDFSQILSKIPSLSNFDLQLRVVAFDRLIDSSNVNIHNWIEIGKVIFDNYTAFDGFIVIHGTDTMAYSASALSYMLEGLNKPVIFTGSQLPIGAARSDARENLVTAIEIASMQIVSRPFVSEVCIYFNNFLLRGNRSKKVESVQFDAFESENYPVLAEAGVLIEFNQVALKSYDENSSLKMFTDFETNVAILKLFPGISESFLRSFLNIEGLRGLVLETYGSGNAPTYPWFISLLREAIAKGLTVFNVSQCMGGKVIQGRYETSKDLQEIGVLSGSDITTEAAITKLMYVLGKAKDINEVRKYLTMPLRGEMD